MEDKYKIQPCCLTTGLTRGPERATENPLLLLVRWAYLQLFYKTRVRIFVKQARKLQDAQAEKLTSFQAEKLNS